MISHTQKYLINGISFFVLILFLSISSPVPQHVSGQGSNTCSKPYSNELFGIKMYYPSDFLDTGADISKAPAWIGSLTNQFGAGSAFLDVKPTNDTLGVYALKKHATDLSSDPTSVDEIKPTNVTLAGNHAVQYEYTYTGPDKQLWASYVVLMKHPYNGQIYEFNFVAPVNNFQGYLDDIKCMTDSFQVR